ncbi:tetratricopeptide repeat protein [Flavobacterium stagni]|uniref:Tetratricopeptide repeat protein n=2 Tax=Flavobacterium stagni TaxID=2506421 RepID=A0A4Q1KCN3_9FLAO|nr:tetratricopeptide repeat protein [Flavobacterium sp. N1719]RXR24279.1 tetratricopeptide repeat protein [Flavobacterium stagni]
MKKMKSVKRIFTVWIGCFAGVFAQENKSALPDGNAQFEAKKYAAAESNYRVASASNKKQESTAEYNLGTAIYKQNQAGEAKFKFLKAAETAQSKPERHKAYHNLGNALMLEKKYDLAEQAYKNALRNNPNDEETRYNYALAKKKNKENPPPHDGGKKKDEKSKEKEKNQRPDDNKGDQEDQRKKPENNPKNSGGPQKQPDPQPRPSGQNKQRIDNLLDAVNNEEKKVQLKRKDKDAQASPERPEKDW